MSDELCHKISKLTKARVLIATIRQLGGCPCTRCLIPTGRLHNLGMVRDRQQHTTLVRSDASRSQLVATAHSFIYEKNYGVDSTAVESLLKPDSWVPTSVSVTIISLYFTDPSLERIGRLPWSIWIQRICCACRRSSLQV